MSGIVARVLTFRSGAPIVLRDHGSSFSVDTWWIGEFIEHRAPFWDALSRTTNFIGGGVVAVFIVPVLIIAALLLVKRPWAAGYFLVATLVTGSTVQLLKHLFGRARLEDILVTVDFGSLPSGHVANAATMAPIVAILPPLAGVCDRRPVHVRGGVQPHVSRCARADRHHRHIASWN